MSKKELQNQARAILRQIETWTGKAGLYSSNADAVHYQGTVDRMMKFAKTKHLRLDPKMKKIG